MNGPEHLDLPQRQDLSWIEGLAMAPLVAAVVWIGVAPGTLIASLISEGTRVVGAR